MLATDAQTPAFAENADIDTRAYKDGKPMTDAERDVLLAWGYGNDLTRADGSPYLEHEPRQPIQETFTRQDLAAATAIALAVLLICGAAASYFADRSWNDYNAQIHQKR
jgi:hypothetical protein